MIELIYQSCVFITMTDAEAAQIRAYLGWSDYMLTKLYLRSNDEDDRGPDRQTPQLALRGRFRELDVLLRMAEWGHRSCTPNEAVTFTRINNKSEIRGLYEHAGYLTIGFSSTLVEFFENHLSLGTILDLAETLDRRLPGRVSYPHDPEAFTRFLSAINGDQSYYSERYLSTQQTQEMAYLKQIITSSTFEPLYRSLIDMAPYHTMLRTWIERIAPHRKVTPKWIAGYLSAKGLYGTGKN